MRRKIQLELAFGPAAKGEAPSAGDAGTEARAASAWPERPTVRVGPSMEAVVERDNLRKALARVRRNKGAPGVDGMTVDELASHLKDHWPEIRARLLAGTYRPQPVRRVEIPNPAGGLRPLGVPTVLDRFIQQAALQVLQAAWDPTFSAASYGFRPGRSAHQAVRAAQEHLAAGRGAGAPRRGSRDRRGPRPGEVLRPGEPRRADGAGGEAGVRPAHPEADPRLPDRGRAGGWAGGPDGRGDAARRAALAAAVEPDAGRAGPGAGAPRPPLRPLRRRLQHLRAVGTGGRAGDGERRAVPRPAPRAEGEQGQERGRPSGRAQVPGVQLHGRGPAPAAHRAAGAGPVQEPGPGAEPAERRQEPRADYRGSGALPDRLARLLRLLRDPVGVAQARPVGQAALALPGVALRSVG